MQLFRSSAQQRSGGFFVENHPLFQIFIYSSAVVHRRRACVTRPFNRVFDVLYVCVCACVCVCVCVTPDPRNEMPRQLRPIRKISKKREESRQTIDENNKIVAQAAAADAIRQIRTPRNAKTPSKKQTRRAVASVSKAASAPTPTPTPVLTPMNSGKVKIEQSTPPERAQARVRRLLIEFMREADLKVNPIKPHVGAPLRAIQKLVNAHARLVRAENAISEVIRTDPLHLRRARACEKQDLIDRSDEYEVNSYEYKKMEKDLWIDCEFPRLEQYKSACEEYDEKLTRFFALMMTKLEAPAYGIVYDELSALVNAAPVGVENKKK